MDLRKNILEESLIKHLIILKTLLCSYPFREKYSVFSYPFCFIWVSLILLQAKCHFLREIYLIHKPSPHPSQVWLSSPLCYPIVIRTCHSLSYYLSWFQGTFIYVPSFLHLSFTFAWKLHDGWNHLFYLLLCLQDGVQSLAQGGTREIFLVDGWTYKWLHDRLLTHRLIFLFWAVYKKIITILPNILGSLGVVLAFSALCQLPHSRNALVKIVFIDILNIWEFKTSTAVAKLRHPRTTWKGFKCGQDQISKNSYIQLF